MAVISGTGSGTINLDGVNLQSRIRSFSIVNKAGSNITFTVNIIERDQITKNITNTLAITSVSATLSSGQAYIRDVPIEVKSFGNIQIIASGSIDYYFTVDVPFDTLFTYKY